MNTKTIGTWLSLPNESIAEIFANAGYEWIVIDLEHSAININQAERLIRIINLSGSKPYVRLTDHNPSQIKRVLDAGAKGIIAPMVETANQIELIIKACNYPPKGFRGMGLARAQGYGYKKKKEDYIQKGCNELEIFVQIESEKAVNNIASIFSYPIDGFFIGPYDLSASLGTPGKFETEAFKSSESKILEEAKKAEIKSGFHLVEPEIEAIDDLYSRGYDMIAFSVDIRMLDKMARLPFAE